MNEYLTLSVGVIFLTIVISFVIPDGKLNKTINFVMRLICILVLIQPALQLFNFTDEQTSIIDYDYICQVYASSQAQLLEQDIYDNFAVDCCCVVQVEYDKNTFNVNGITIILTDFVDEQTKQQIYAYLSDLGYIDINVNEKAD